MNLPFRMYSLQIAGDFAETTDGTTPPKRVVAVSAMSSLSILDFISR